MGRINVHKVDNVGDVSVADSSSCKLPYMWKYTRTDIINFFT